MMRGAILAAALVLAAPVGAFAEEQSPAVAEATGDAGAAEDDSLPLAAARRRHLVEPTGHAPSPWGALAATYDSGVTADGHYGWSALRVHVPVARRYGAVDFRLVGDFDSDGFRSLGPEITLRGMPLQLADGRGVLGFAFGMYPSILGEEPLIDLGGGLMGGYLGNRWFTWAYAGVRGEVLYQESFQVEGTFAIGLRLPYGLRPQVELDIAWEPSRLGDLNIAVRPAFRYWPAEWIGIGLSADIWATGPDLETSAIRIDVVGHAME